MELRAKNVGNNNTIKIKTENIYDWLGHITKDKVQELNAKLVIAKGKEHADWFIRIPIFKT